MKRIKVGTFEVKSGSLIVSDPCYQPETWCQGKLENVQNGHWVAYIEGDPDEEGRIAMLMAVWEECPVVPIESGWKAERFEVGVDSGQAGVFDAAHYRDAGVVAGIERLSKEVICPEDEWYSLCCDRTMSEKGAGVIPFGCVSSSGYGDGAYRCCTLRNWAQKVVGVKIVFVE